MEMTTPVFTKENTMQFVVSGESMDALPASTNEKVVLQEEKGGIFVAKKFSGYGDGKNRREKWRRSCASARRATVWRRAETRRWRSTTIRSPTRSCVGTKSSSRCRISRCNLTHATDFKIL